VTGQEAHETVIDAIKNHYRTNGSQDIAHIQLPWGIAWDLAKLRACEIGELAGHIFRDGPIPKHLSQLYGYPVKIDKERETGSIQIGSRPR
jgi:hypothetical protein